MAYNPPEGHEEQHDHTEQRVESNSDGAQGYVAIANSFTMAIGMLSDSSEFVKLVFDGLVAGSGPYAAGLRKVGVARSTLAGASGHQIVGL